MPDGGSERRLGTAAPSSDELRPQAAVINEQSSYLMRNGVHVERSTAANPGRKSPLGPSLGPFLFLPSRSFRERFRFCPS